MNEDYPLIDSNQVKTNPKGGVSLQRFWFAILFTMVLTVAIVLAITLPLVLLTGDDDDSGSCDPESPCLFRSPVQRYVDLIAVSSLQTTERALQQIAMDNGGNRAVGTLGYAASVDYILQQLEKHLSGFCAASTQTFSVPTFENLVPPLLSEVSPSPQPFTDFQIMSFSGSGNVTAEAVALPQDPTGCTAEAWQGFPAGAVALVARGDCSFREKAEFAALHNASGALFYNYDSLDGFSGSMGVFQPFPCFGISHALGVSLAAQDPPAEVNMFASTRQEHTETQNVLCTTLAGDPNSTVVIGSHLDSVPAGPGINDNGSGSSLNLAIARAMRKSGLEVVNRVVFAWWAAEEVGLQGSSYFVNQLFQSGQLGTVALNLNFDMIGSPNGMRGVYLGAQAEDPTIRQASGDIEDMFIQYFTAQGLAYRGDPFDGRSDYGPFIAVGIPAGGLFTGAEKVKTPDERGMFGGWANAPYDPCYHQACDTTENIDWQMALENTRAAAYVAGTLVSHPDLPRFLSTPDFQAVTEHRNNRVIQHRAIEVVQHKKLQKELL